MKYRDSVEKSAENLRRILPLMSKQAAAMHPVSYAVWYEYVAGENRALKADIDQYLQNKQVLNEEVTYDLYSRYVADMSDERAQQISDNLQRVMADMSHSAAETGTKVGQFGNALESLSGDMALSGPGSSGQSIETILDLTRNMEGSIASLKDNLDESRREIEQLRQDVVKAREEALIDGLTGLTNRRGFDLAIAACLAESKVTEGGLSLLMADIDHFKLINDTWGHLFGDRVIQAVAQILKGNVKGKDTAARYGGEEFVILLPNTPIGGACQFAEKIRMMVEKVQIKRASDKEVVAQIRISLGVACLKTGESAAEFVSRADAALYQSKGEGRNRVTVAA